MKKLIIAFVFFTLLLSNCTMPSKSSDTTINDIKDKLIYFQDKKGLCYAAIESNSYFGYHIISITNIPCTKKGE